MTALWSAPTTSEAAARRAGGRRHYNARRQWLASRRRYLEVAPRLFAQGSPFRHGFQTELARELGVSRSTICRDIDYLLRMA